MEGVLKVAFKTPSFIFTTDGKEATTNRCI
jgi:hypothetical protein